MRSISAVILLAAAACSGCHSAPKPPPPVSVAAIADESAGSAAATVGQEVVVTLSGNAGTGYSWSCSPPPGVRLLSNTAAAAGAETMPGSPTVWTIRVVADVPGVHAVRFDLARPWETGVPPARTYTLTLTAN